MPPLARSADMKILFEGSSGRYEIVLPDGDASLEDRSISVIAGEGERAWVVEVDRRDADGTRKLYGLTQDGLWFELSIGDVVEMSYWANRNLVRTDKAVLH